ncbi:MAG: hypothetical protein AVDCRST_MAG01-01-3383, partial [uncultured Rubrobacteraceae bacterium]
GPINGASIPVRLGGRLLRRPTRSRSSYTGAPEGPQHGSHDL